MNAHINVRVSPKEKSEPISLNTSKIVSPLLDKNVRPVTTRKILSIFIFVGFRLSIIISRIGVKSTKDPVIKADFVADVVVKPTV